MLRLPDSGRVRCEDEDKEKTFENPAAFCNAQRHSADTTSAFRMSVTIIVLRTRRLLTSSFLS